MVPVLTRRYVRRQHRCYELCGKILLDNPDWFLVHGTVSVCGMDVFHAWLEHDEGWVFDAVSNESQSADAYYQHRRAVSLNRYRFQEAAPLLLSNGHWGPW
jgi:hypothetical protein